jgi:acyl-CoA reductase-like NAD-dependent aldehyde dehydrogenase
MTAYKLLIGGKLVPGAMTSTVINPATEDVLATAPRADLAQLHQAVAAAKAAFPVWSATPIRVRGALLTKLADAMAARQAELARLLT